MDHVQVTREIWSALSRGDLASLEATLAPQAKWRAVEDGPWNCESRSAIIDVMGRNLATGRLSGQIQDAFEVDGHVIVGFRPDEPDGWPLDNGVRYVVVTLEGDHVTEMKGCPSREAALAYVHAR